MASTIKIPERSENISKRVLTISEMLLALFKVHSPTYITYCSNQPQNPQYLLPSSYEFFWDYRSFRMYTFTESNESSTLSIIRLDEFMTSCVGSYVNSAIVLHVEESSAPIRTSTGTPKRSPKGGNIPLGSARRFIALVTHAADRFHDVVFDAIAEVIEKNGRSTSAEFGVTSGTTKQDSFEIRHENSLSRSSIRVTVCTKLRSKTTLYDLTSVDGLHHYFIWIALRIPGLSFL